VARPPRLLWLGYIRPEKGLQILIEAFDRLRAERPLALTIAGATDSDTQAGSTLVRRIAARPYARNIRRIGQGPFGAGLFDLYRSHDLFVLPSLSEGTPRTLLEARAFSCPVVASRVGGIPSTVTSGEDGWLVPPGDPAALAAAIRLGLEDGEVRARVVAQG